MNLFVLDRDPVAAARAQCDKHVVKMPLETAQMLCAVLTALGVRTPYRATHTRHPCTLWVGETRENWAWAVEHGLALADEYARRYGKEHKSRAVIEWAAAHGERPGAGALTPFAQAMPDQYRDADPVVAYRAFYRAEKARFATWRAPATTPAWWPQQADLRPVVSSLTFVRHDVKSGT